MNRDALFLHDILKACEKVSRFIEAGKDEFLANEMIQDAVIRNIEIIGEAAKQLSPETKSLAPEEPWRQIGAMRDKLIHHYFGVNLERVWQTAKVVLPPFQVKVSAMLSRLESNQRAVD